MIPLAPICLALIALLAYREWGLARERREWRDERHELLQRIQAPELAVLPKFEPVAYVGAEDDEAYWQAVGERKD